MNDGQLGNCELNHNLFVIEKGNIFFERKGALERVLINL